MRRCRTVAQQRRAAAAAAAAPPGPLGDEFLAKLAANRGAGIRDATRVPTLTTGGQHSVPTTRMGVKVSEHDTLGQALLMYGLGLHSEYTDPRQKPNGLPKANELKEGGMAEVVREALAPLMLGTAGRCLDEPHPGTTALLDHLRAEKAAADARNEVPEAAPRVMAAAPAVVSDESLLSPDAVARRLERLTACRAAPPQPRRGRHAATLSERWRVQILETTDSPPPAAPCKLNSRLGDLLRRQAEERAREFPTQPPEAPSVASPAYDADRRRFESVLQRVVQGGKRAEAAGVDAQPPQPKATGVQAQQASLRGALNGKEGTPSQTRGSDAAAPASHAVKNSPPTSPSALAGAFAQLVGKPNKTAPPAEAAAAEKRASSGHAGSRSPDAAEPVASRAAKNSPPTSPSALAGAFAQLVGKPNKTAPPAEAAAAEKRASSGHAGPAAAKTDDASALAGAFAQLVAHSSKRASAAATVEDSDDVVAPAADAVAAASEPALQAPPAPASGRDSPAQPTTMPASLADAFAQLGGLKAGGAAPQPAVPPEPKVRMEAGDAGPTEGGVFAVTAEDAVTSRGWLERRKDETYRRPLAKGPSVSAFYMKHTR
eukprot:TRINITY_DN1458_c0_g1_i2.p1 TRINITY_DN1458_c0_g1~~TRINITY_DN1458_c0_g1_i2.p1  ORF type:complete len:602 (+),score=122.79 TRINITY_DN1458_c0_g1_i2:55-1860(+)